MMAPHFSRRHLIVGAAALPAAAQQPAAPPPVPATPEEERKAVDALNRANADQLVKVPLPMSTEPAVHFKP